MLAAAWSSHTMCERQSNTQLHARLAQDLAAGEPSDTLQTYKAPLLRVVHARESHLVALAVTWWRRT